MEESWPPTDSTNLKRNKDRTFEHPCNYIVNKRPIGEGSYSTVFECKNVKTSKHYAGKRYTKKLVFGIEDMLQNEFHVLKQVSMGHKNLLNLVDYFETEKYIYLVTNLARGGELYDRIIKTTKLTERETVGITRQLADAIDYLHCNNVIHRDIKAENVLFQNSTTTNILLADFGLARILKPGQMLLDRCGTLSYIAPEIFGGSYSFSVDIWAMGVVVYFLLCGYMPFDCDNEQETIETIKSGAVLFEPPEYWSHVSNSAKDFISKCFVVDPSKRMTSLDALIHPFLASISAHSSSTRLSTFSSFNSSSTALTRSASNLSLLNKLRDSLLALQSLASSEGKLRGALCESPDTISRFNTPCTSTNVSRAQSMECMNSPPAPMVADKTDTYFYI